MANSTARRGAGTIKRYVKGMLRPWTHPWMTRKRLVEGLRVLGVRSNGVLLVHSSLSALGHVPGGAPTVIGSLLELVGSEGTLVMPTHSWEWMDQGCRTFDVKGTPSCVGAITECFRSMPGVCRSLHPTHSVAAWGSLAELLVGGHELCQTPCGANTPYARIVEQNGQILFLGIGLEYHTLFHTVEALAETPYLLREEPDEFTVITGRGTRRQVVVFRHRAGIPRNFADQETTLCEMGIARRGKVRHVDCILVEGGPFLDKLVPLLRTDPKFLLAKQLRSMSRC